MQWYCSYLMERFDHSYQVYFQRVSQLVKLNFEIIDYFMCQGQGDDCYDHQVEMNQTQVKLSFL